MASPIFGIEGPTERGTFAGLQDTMQTARNNLQHLPQRDRETLVALVRSATILGALGRSRLPGATRRLAAIQHPIWELAPEVAMEFDAPGKSAACLDASVAYASAMARCQEDNPDKTEDQCHQENSSAAAAEVACVVRQLDDLQALLDGLVASPPEPAG